MCWKSYSLLKTLGRILTFSMWRTLQIPKTTLYQISNSNFNVGHAAKKMSQHFILLLLLTQFCLSQTDFCHQSVKQSDRGDVALLLWCPQMRLSASLHGQLCCILCVWDCPAGCWITRFQSLQSNWKTEVPWMSSCLERASCLIFEFSRLAAV